VAHDAGPDANDDLPNVVFETFDEALVFEVETADPKAGDEGSELLSKGSQTETETDEQECQTESGPDSRLSGPALSIFKFEHNPEMVKFYTGFETYEHFLYVYHCLGPAAEELQYKSKTLEARDELFLCIVKLRQDKEDVELGFLFGISRQTAGRVFNTWLNFLYFQFKEIELFRPKAIVDMFCPEDFKKKFPNTRIILDATEIRIQKPSKVKDQRSTWSSYKNGNTLKTMVGCSPRGVVTYLSKAYGGSASDRQIIENSELLDGRFNSGDSIMADRGILVQDLFAGQNVNVNTPTTMRGRNQLPAETVVKDRRIASKRVHVERVIGLAKTYKILQNELDHSRTPVGGRILCVCFVLSNFRSNIVPKYA
jgi:hypothetical protein